MTVATTQVKVLVTESCAANTGDLITLDALEPAVLRDLVYPCADCTINDPVYHLEPGTSWFLVNRAVRDGR